MVICFEIHCATFSDVVHLKQNIISDEKHFQFSGDGVSLFFSCEKQELCEIPPADPSRAKIDAVKDQINTDLQSMSLEEQEVFDHFLFLGKKLRDAIQDYPELRQDIIHAIRLEFYEDESILLSDLFEDASPAFKGTIRTGMGDKWRQALGVEDRTSSATERQSVLEKFIKDKKIQVYWPYSDTWLHEKDILPAVTFYPVGQDSVNFGWKLTKDSYYEVFINDDYAIANPTWILNYYEGSIFDEIVNRSENKAEGRSGACSLSNPAFNNCSLYSDRLEVFIGEVKFFQHYDDLFSGGPEFRWARGNLTVDANGFPTGLVPQFASGNLKRGDRYSWACVSNYWDTEWEPEVTRQNIVLYEEDQNGSVTVTVSATVKPENSSVSQTLATSSTRPSKNSIIFSQDFSRCWFLDTNDDAFPFENRSGWNVRGSTGEVKWTMPTREL